MGVIAHISTKVAILEMAFLQQLQMDCFGTICDEWKDWKNMKGKTGFYKNGLAPKNQLANMKRDKFLDVWYVNHEGINLAGANAYGYYDWFAPEEGEEGYILAKHEGSE